MKLKLIECPRDAMQGWKKIIPAAQKIRYMNSLLRVGFDTLDCGSFVSPKAIPQMADTGEVLRSLDMASTKTKLLTIVANERGASEALAFDSIFYIGFPFSVSETFQQRNTNTSIQGAVERIDEIQNLCIKSGKTLVIYISMGFGNPYGDPYDEDIMFGWVSQLVQKDISIISLADTVGVATPEQVFRVTKYLKDALQGVEIGVHLHSSPLNHDEKLKAAWDAGCRRFDGALKGIGGCPMANDELVGNMNTEMMIAYLESTGIDTGIDKVELAKSLEIANEIFV